MCLECIGSMSFFQKKDFYSEEIEPNFGTESWFDGKKLQKSYIVYRCNNSNIPYMPRQFFDTKMALYYVLP